jgi:hypothetical protein
MINFNCQIRSSPANFKITACVFDDLTQHGMLKRHGRTNNPISIYALIDYDTDPLIRKFIRAKITINKLNSLIKSLFGECDSLFGKYYFENLASSPILSTDVAII